MPKRGLCLSCNETHADFHNMVQRSGKRDLEARGGLLHSLASFPVSFEIRIWEFHPLSCPSPDFYAIVCSETKLAQNFAKWSKEARSGRRATRLTSLLTRAVDPGSPDLMLCFGAPSTKSSHRWLHQPRSRLFGSRPSFLIN